MVGRGGQSTAFKRLELVLLKLGKHRVEPPHGGRDGGQALVRFIGPGEMFGTVPLFTDHRFPAADAIAVEASTVLTCRPDATACGEPRSRSRCDARILPSLPAPRCIRRAERYRPGRRPGCSSPTTSVSLSMICPPSATLRKAVGWRLPELKA